MHRYIFFPKKIKTIPLTATACSLELPMVAVVVVPTSSASALKVILNGRTWAMAGRKKGKCFYILTEFDNTLWSDYMVFCAFEISSMKNST